MTMRQKYLLILACVFAAMMPSGRPGRAGGLLLNSGFDDSPVALPSPGWKIPENAGVCQIADDDGHSGKQCLRFRTETPGKIAPVVQEFSCLPDHDYVLSAWFKSSGVSRPAVCLDVQGRNTPALSLIGEGRDEKWRFRHAAFNSGTNTRFTARIYADIAAFTNGGVPAGTAWVDDVNVQDSAEFARDAEKARADESSNVANIARGKPYVFDPKPDYSYCTDKDDATQLTDGEYTRGFFWTQKSTVGWQNARCAVITIDLQKVEPICGLSFNTAAGTSGVEWPLAIMIFTGDDGRSFNYAGDLIEMCRKEGLPASEKYAVHRYITRALETKGRYVRLAVVDRALRFPNFTFCDEIEVYRGPDSFLQKPACGERVENVRDFCRAKIGNFFVRKAMLQDLDSIRQNLLQKEIAAKQRQEMGTELRDLEEAVKTTEFFSVTNPQYRAVAPLNELHAGILKANAGLLRASGFPPLFAWHKNRWDPLSAVESPEQAPSAPPSLHVEMMDNEYRAEAVNLLNTTKSNLTVLLAIEGLPGGRNPEWVAAHQVEFVGTQKGEMIADPLPAAKRMEAGWLIDLPSGMTRQVWLTFHPVGVKPGVYNGEIRVRPADQGGIAARIVQWIPGLGRGLRVPLGVRIHPFRFPDRPRLSLGMWDYTDKPYGFGVCTESNVHASFADMRAHFVDTPWAHRSSACWPEKEDFDQEGNLVKPLRTAGFDNWIREWKDSRNYFIYLALNTNKSDFAGETMGTPRFNKMVRNWAAAFAAYAKKSGIDQKQIGFDLVDEPGKPEEYRINAVWAEQINAGAPEFVLFTDAARWDKRWEKRSPEFEKMLAVHDIFCPLLPFYRGMDEAKERILRSTGSRAKRLWFYSCIGPARLFDPYYYHRLQAWQCRRNGAVGMGFWNYWNSYSEPGCSAWNEFMAARESFGVVYATPDSITGGKHWEAVREGVEDYEYLAMLQDRIAELKARGIDAPDVAVAERLLKAVVDETAPGYYEERLQNWSDFKDRSVADRARVRVLRTLSALMKR